jgi:hypothetical protein
MSSRKSVEERLINRAGALWADTSLGRMLRSYVPSKPRLYSTDVDRIES